MPNELLGVGSQVELPNGRPMRITQILDRMAGTVECMAEEGGVGTVRASVPAELLAANHGGPSVGKEYRVRIDVEEVDHDKGTVDVLCEPMDIAIMGSAEAAAELVGCLEILLRKNHQNT